MIRICLPHKPFLSIRPNIPADGHPVPTAAGKEREAAQEFQELLDVRYAHPGSYLPSLSKLGLAKGYTLQGDTAQARSAYQDFFAFWKDADPDIPILKEAKEEYAKLK